MDISEIETIAKRVGLNSHMYERPALTELPGGDLAIVSNGKLTIYGQKLIEFANEIETAVLMRFPYGTTD